MTTQSVWDVAIYAEQNGIRRIGLPRAISRALDDKGFNRAILRITDKGLLLVPYAASHDANGKQGAVAELPEWSVS